jgi:phosphoribosylformimino-5-aminoimidazole carboxamide ribotide isomerase
MRIIPVMDLKAGHVVRACAGRRQDYQPIRSRLTPSSQPQRIAEAFRAHFGFTELYVADLDAIAGTPATLPTYTCLRDLGFYLWADAGVRDVGAVEPLLEAGLDKIVVGLETVAGPGALAHICRRIEANRVVFSLDLKDGLALAVSRSWRQPDAWSIAAQAIEIGVRQVIVLDLARVGGYGGTGTQDFCRQLAAAYPDVKIMAGGGIRGVADLECLEACRVRAALVASALHDGRLQPEDLDRWRERET